MAQINHFKLFFSLQNSKTTYYEPFQPTSTIFHLLIKLFSIGLKLYGVVWSKVSFVDWIDCIGVLWEIGVRLHANCLPISIPIMFREICSGDFIP